MTPPQPTTLGARILYLRDLRGLTQGQLAELIGVTVPAVSRWENGHSRPDPESLGALSRKLLISADWLLGLPPLPRHPE